MVTQTQKTMFEERVSSWTDVQQQNWAKLKERLLSRGGQDVVPYFSYDDDTLRILAGNETFIIGDDCDLVYNIGNPSDCHQNVVRLWKARSIQHIYTGYGLSEDGLWRAHSWGINLIYQGKDLPEKITVVETTIERLIYYGMEVA